MKSYRVRAEIVLEAEDLEAAFRWLAEFFGELGRGGSHRRLRRGIVQIDEEGVRVWEEGAEPR